MKGEKACGRDIGGFIFIFIYIVSLSQFGWREILTQFSPLHGYVTKTLDDCLEIVSLLYNHPIIILCTDNYPLLFGDVIMTSHDCTEITQHTAN